MATHAGTVAAGWWEIETGAEFDRLDGEESVSVPTVFKIGLASNVQWSIFATAVRPAGAPLGAGDVATGFKWRILDDAPVLGDVALLPSIKFPTGSTAAGRGTGTTDGSLLLISSHDLRGIALDINVGATRRSGDGSRAPRTSTLWTASLGGSVAGALGYAAEIFGYPGTSGPAGASPVVALLGGPTWQFKKWFVVDAGVISPLTGEQPHALYVGGVYNVGRWR